MPPPTRPGYPRAVTLLAAAFLGACAAARPPQTFRFASNRDPAAALQCAANRLRIEGFDLLVPAVPVDAAAHTADIAPADSAAPPAADTAAVLPAPVDSSGKRPPAADSVPPPPAPSGPMVALRRTESTTEVGANEWWRVEVTISRDDVGTTVVESLAGVAARMDGPFREPTVPLQSIIGKISASCTF